MRPLLSYMDSQISDYTIADGPGVPSPSVFFGLMIFEGKP